MYYFFRKLGLLIVSIWVAITMNFFIPRLIPGNPAEAYLASMQGRVSLLELHAIELRFGVTNAPLWKQYLSYLINLFHGKLGISTLYYPENVATVIGMALPWTIGLVGVTTLLAFVVGTLLGIYNSWHRNGRSDSILSPIFMFLQSVPGFWLGLVLLWYFGLIRGWFPLSHSYSDGAVPSLSFSFAWDVLRHAFLPGFSLFITSIGGWMLLMRNNMIQTLGDDYVVLASAKGVRPRRLMLNYAARNAILPVFTNFALALASVVGGSILIETIFSYPGVGYQLAQAVEGQDYDLVQGLFLVITIAVLLANFLADILYGRLDPRVRTEAK